MLCILRLLSKQVDVRKVLHLCVMKELTRKEKASRIQRKPIFWHFFMQWHFYFIYYFITLFTSSIKFDTAWKVSIFKVFLVRILPHSNWIRFDISPYSVRKRENTNQKSLRIETLFMQCEVLRFLSNRIKLPATTNHLIIN